MTGALYSINNIQTEDYLHTATVLQSHRLSFILKWSDFCWSSSISQDAIWRII